MKYFLLAIQFLTILPIKQKAFIDDKDYSVSVGFFPIVGLLLGFLLVGIDILLIDIFPQDFINLIIVTFLAILSGGMHLDGLSDTFDGIGSFKDKDKMLDIMHDSRLGAMGVISLIIVILFKIQCLSMIPQSFRHITILLLPAISRWSIILPMFCFNYARLNGKTKVFFGNLKISTLILSALLILSLMTVFYNIWGIVIVFIIGFISFMIGQFFNAKIGGITGDVLGACIEINEVCFLILIYIFKAKILFVL